MGLHIPVAIARTNPFCADAWLGHAKKIIRCPALQYQRHEKSWVILGYTILEIQPKFAMIANLSRNKVSGRRIADTGLVFFCMFDRIIIKRPQTLMEEGQCCVAAVIYARCLGKDNIPTPFIQNPLVGSILDFVGSTFGGARKRQFMCMINVRFSVKLCGFSSRVGTSFFQIKPLYEAHVLKLNVSAWPHDMDLTTFIAGMILCLRCRMLSL